MFRVFRTDGDGRLLVHQESIGALAPHDVVVRVAAVSLNFRDMPFVRGNQFRPAVAGRIPFTDAVGVVEAVGSAATRFKRGDRVLSTVLPNWLDGPLTAEGLAGSLGSRERDGVFADLIRHHEQELVAAPSYLGDIEAATLPVAALTAWHAVAEAGQVGPGDTVVVQTTGGVALFAVQFAVALGATVIVISRSDDKLRRAIELGAASVINSVAHADWDRDVLARTGGTGAQLVLDMGLTESLLRSGRAAAYEGMVAVIGVVEQYVTPLDIFTVMNKNLRVRGIETGSRAMFERMNAFMVQHGIRPVVDAVYAPEQADAALDRLATSPFGKVVIEWPASAA